MTMTEFWEAKFREIETAWGMAPSDSAIEAAGLFSGNGGGDILIPGIGYGRNARIFIEKGMAVTGIEISGTAIRLAKEKNGIDCTIHHGSVSRMPFDDRVFDGIYCYALIHLFNKAERKQLIRIQQRTNSGNSDSGRSAKLKSR